MDQLSPSTVAGLATASAIVVASMFLRIVLVVRGVHSDRLASKLSPTASSSSLGSPLTAAPSDVGGGRAEKRTVKTMSVLGSGGHTTEMIRLLEDLDPRWYAPIVYVLADSDDTSVPRLSEHIREEEGRGRGGSWRGRRPVGDGGGSGEDCAEVHILPRAREVGQPYASSAITTLGALARTLAALRRVRPELILANGPGTCVPVIYAAFVIFRLLPFLGGGGGCRIVFIESLCRVRTLSLSGRLVYPIVDRFVVHWPGLEGRYPMAERCDVFVRS